MGHPPSYDSMATLLVAGSALSGARLPNTNAPGCCCAKPMLWMGAGTNVGGGGAGASLYYINTIDLRTAQPEPILRPPESAHSSSAHTPLQATLTDTELWYTLGRSTLADLAPRVQKVACVMGGATRQWINTAAYGWRKGLTARPTGSLHGWRGQRVHSCRRRCWRLRCWMCSRLKTTPAARSPASASGPPPLDTGLI